MTFKASRVPCLHASDPFGDSGFNAFCGDICVFQLNDGRQFVAKIKTITDKLGLVDASGNKLKVDISSITACVIQQRGTGRG